jgi:hypothetical protein
MNYSRKCEVMVNNGVIFKPIFSTQPTPMYGDILLDTESKFKNAHKEIEYKLYEEEEKKIDLYIETLMTPPMMLVVHF